MELIALNPGSMRMGQVKASDAAFELASIISADGDMEVMASTVLTFLIETLPVADAGILWLYDPSTGRLAPKAAQGHTFSVLSQMRLSPSEALSGKAFQTGQSALYSTPEETAAAMAEMTSTNRALFTAATAGMEQPKSALCAPLIVGQTKIGVLTLENLHTLGRFVLDDLKLPRYAADLLAVCIENARLNEELQISQAINESNQDKVEALAFLAHEMRTPLTSIKGYSTALLLEEATFSPETQHEFLHLIDEECDTLVNLIHDLLESSYIDAGSLKIERQPALLPRLAENAADEIGRHAHQHRFLVEFSRQFPIVEVDPDRITQVLRNLLDNAVKYSPQGGLIVVRGEVGQNEIVISVADQGLGIAPEHLNRLFEKFFRVKSGSAHGTIGSGLGLPIARSIVESHGGRIWAESRLGQGSTFYFTLPLPDTSHALTESREGEGG